MKKNDMNKNNPDELPENGAENEWMELVRTAVIAVLIALLVRSIIAEPFNIPSGSMKPGLLVGDYLFVSKYEYGYSKYSFPYGGMLPVKGRIWEGAPERGDVVVFKLPSDNKTDYIKRVIGMPGDRIQMRGGRLYINDEIVPRKLVDTFEDDAFTRKRYLQTLPNGRQFYILEGSDNADLDNTKIFTVPEGHYFMMGDNRDNSQDSRAPQRPGYGYVGFVPIENIIGEAKFLFFSTNGSAQLWEPWKWPWTVRYDRLLKGID